MTASLRTALALLLVAPLLAAACGGADDGDAPPPATATRSARTPVAASTAPPSPGDGDAVEVTGIVGSVDTAAGVIEITALAGADVTRITLAAGAPVRQAGGGRISLSQIRVSDRIIASGRLDDATGELVADEITVGSVTSGPSGG